MTRSVASTTRSRGMQRGRQRIRAHRGVGIDVVEPRGRAFRFERREIPLAVDARKLLVRRRRGVVVLKVGIEPRADEAVADGAAAGPGHSG